MISRRIVGTVPTVSCSTNQRVGLTGRASDQYGVVIAICPDGIQSLVDFGLGNIGAEFETHRLLFCGFPFGRMRRDQFVARNLAGNVAVICIGDFAKLPRERSKPQGPKCRRLLFDGKGDVENGSPFPSDRRKPLRKASWPSKQIHGLEDTAHRDEISLRDVLIPGRAEHARENTDWSTLSTLPPDQG